MSEILELVKQIREAVDRLEKITTPEKQVDPLVPEMDTAEAKWNEMLKKQADLQKKADAKTATAAEIQELSYMPGRISDDEQIIADICFKQHARRSVKTDEDGYVALLDIFTTKRNLRYLDTVITADPKRQQSVKKEAYEGIKYIEENIKTLKSKQITNSQAIVDSFFEWLNTNKTTTQRIAAFRAHTV